MRTLFTNIKELLQVRENSVLKVSGEQMKILPTIKNAFLLIDDDKITDFGTMDDMPDIKSDKIIDVSGQIVLPCWCDSHTHIVYSGNREQEFVDRIGGLSYQQIAEKGGGILNSAKKLQQTDEFDLYHQSAIRLEQVMSMGTGSIEIKSGYGLSPDAELKMLRVIKELKKNYSIPIKSTFLGAHAFPAQYKSDRQGYIDLIVKDMMPKIAKQNLAEFVDVFCETGYFSVEDTDTILAATDNYGWRAKIHVNQFTSIGGVAMGVKHGALSVDHLEVMDDDDVKILKNSDTMPVSLPCCSYFLGIAYTPARKIIDAGLPLALATDFNPGSCPSGNMNFVVSTACIKLKMTPEEAINAATINGAYAMNLSKEVGSITKGKKANLIITKKIPSYGFIPYSFGDNAIDSVFIDGKPLKS